MAVFIQLALDFFFSRENYKLKNLVVKLENIWTFVSRIVQPRVNDSFFSYYFNYFNTQHNNEKCPLFLFIIRNVRGRH